MAAAALTQSVVARINRPIERATGLPNEAYTARAFLDVERERLFGPTWTCIAQACRIPEPGDALPVQFLGTPLLLVRNREGAVNVFHNVCSHRGNELVWEACRVEGRLRCPYHSWTYDLDGRLTSTPHIGGTGLHEVEGFDRAAHGLRAVRAALWHDLVFVNLSADAPAFDTFIEPLAERLRRFASDDQYARFRPARTDGSFELDINANWKLLIENNLESYHLPFVHPGLNAYSRLEDHYWYNGGDLYAAQGSNGYDPVYRSGEPFPRVPGWPEQVAEYPSLFPNVFLGVHCDQFWSIVLHPVSPERTIERFQLYYREEGATDPGYDGPRAETREAWRSILVEDVGVVEGMQRGRRSPAFEGGVFSPVMDTPTHHFHKWVANALSRS